MAARGALIYITQIGFQHSWQGVFWGDELRLWVSVKKLVLYISLWNFENLSLVVDELRAQQKNVIKPQTAPCGRFGSSGLYRVIRWPG